MKPVKPNLVSAVKDTKLISREFDTVDPAAALGMRSSTPNRELMMLRAQFPFVPIMPPPNFVITKLLAANVAQNIDTPDMASIVRLFGDGDFFASFGGNAIVPAAANVGWNDGIARPENIFFYIKDKPQISVISATVNRVVTAAFWTFNFTDEGAEGL